MAALDQLPIEVHHLIFGYLELIEVLTCGLVSKKFNKTVKAFRVKELSFYSSDLMRRSFWFLNRKPIYPVNSVSNRKVTVLNSTAIDLQFLKCLRLFGIVESDEFSLESLNRFENLIVLELRFDVNDWSKGDKIKKLKLKSLKHLYINFGFQIFIEFDSPKLKSVALSYKPNSHEIDQPLETTKFASPSTVKNLFTFGLSLNQMPMNFSSLEHLQCDVLVELDRLLRAFPDLKMLEIDLENRNFSENYMEYLNLIIKQRDQLRPSLKIGFQNIKLSGDRAIESYGFDKESDLSLTIKHSSIMHECSLEKLDYQELLSLTKGGYPIGFLKLNPFHKIHTVLVNNEIDNANSLLDLLLNCINLIYLKLQNSSLDMEFFEQLPAFTSLLNLEIEAGYQNLQLDFRFLLKMTNLVSLETDQNMEVDLLRVLMQRLKFVGWLFFRINDQKFSIVKFEKDRYDLKSYDNGHGYSCLVKEGVNYENLISYLDDFSKSFSLRLK